jgi:hypothetical protein
MKTKAWQHGFSLLQRFGLSFDLQLYSAQMSGAATLALVHPETLIILDHSFTCPCSSVIVRDSFHLFLSSFEGEQSAVDHELPVRAKQR